MSTANSLELGMLALINDERTALGLDPLRLITLLNEAAETHSAWMLAADQFSHQGEGGTSPSDRMEDSGYPFEGSSLALENIGWQSTRGEEGFEDDVAQVHASLMNSPGHRANILNPDAEDIGIGIEIGTFSGNSGDFEAVMVTQVYGTTDADISAFVDPGTGDDSPDIIDDSLVEDDTDAPIEPDAPEDQETPEAQDEPDEDTPVIVDEEPLEPENGDEPDVAENNPEENAPAPLPESMPDGVTSDAPIPCELSCFTVDLSEAFEIRREGDQIILETSEERLVETFMNAFDDLAFMMDAPDEEVDADISDLMMENIPDFDEAAFSCPYDVEDEELATAIV